MEGFCASLQGAVIAFFNGPWARFGSWPPSRRPEEEQIRESLRLCKVGEALSPPIPGSGSETRRL